MTTERIKELVEGVAIAVYHRIDLEHEVLKTEYTAALKEDYEKDEAEDAGTDYEDFDDFLKDRADEYLEFAFIPYIEGILLEIVNLQKTDLEALPKEERERLTVSFLDYFKRMSGLGQESEDL